MIVRAIKTRVVTAKQLSLIDLLEESVNHLEDSSIVVITSKVVSLCEGAVVPIDSIDKSALIKQESQRYLGEAHAVYGHQFTITQDTLIPTAGIDESNGDGHYVLWPKQPQQTANEIVTYLKKRFGLTHVGIIISDSTCSPLRRGTNGVYLAHSGFKALKNYIGKPDLFGKEYQVSQAAIAGGLAAAAVLQMGEGTEQTPIAIIADVPFVEFQDRNPSDEELAELHITPEEDLFSPFLTAVQWETGDAAR